MKKTLIDVTKVRSSQAIGCALIVIAAAMVVSALVAQTPTPIPCPATNVTLPPRNRCINWPCDPKDTVHCTQDFQNSVKTAFEDLMNAASTGDKPGDTKRAQLLDPKQAHAIVADKLNKLNNPPPGFGFGPEHTVMFYEYDNQGTGALRGSCVPDHPNKCVHVFYLPERCAPPTVDVQGNRQGPASFGKNLVCCYQPW